MEIRPEFYWTNFKVGWASRNEHQIEINKKILTSQRFLSNANCM